MSHNLLLVKPVVLISLLVVAGVLLASHTSSAASLHIVVAKAEGAAEVGRTLKQDPEPSCASFYMAPGFGCLLQVDAGCEGGGGFERYFSQASKIVAQQRSGNKTMANLKCTWDAAAFEETPLPSPVVEGKNYTCVYYSGDLPGLAVQVYEGRGTINFLGNGDLVMTCKVNTATDKNLGDAEAFFEAIIGCFHGDSLAITPDGPTPIHEIDVGHKVLAARTDGSLFFDEVVFAPHQDASAPALYYEIDTTVPGSMTGKKLMVTATHYVPVVGSGMRISKMAKDVKVSCVDCCLIDPR